MKKKNKPETPRENSGVSHEPDEVTQDFTSNRPNAETPTRKDAEPTFANQDSSLRIPDETSEDIFADTESTGFSFDNIDKLRELFGNTTNPVGSQIGEYTVQKELGRGGMGVVYKAVHRQLGRDVALKMILLGDHSGADTIDRFLTEAQAIAKLQHPNIVQIFDVGQHEGLPFFSLEYVDGACLGDAISEKPLASEQAAKLVLTIANALYYAHQEGIVHRDIKPANILLTRDNQPKLTDFGLAKLVDSDSSRTRTGQVMGTPSYMSPEQAKGQADSIGPASDQYSLGALLYRLLTGRPPFSASDPVKTILQVANDEPVQPRQLQPDIPRDIETICLKALQKSTDSRYQDCKALAEDLQNFLSNRPIKARPTGIMERAWRWGRRNPGVAISSIATAILLGCITALSTWAYVTVSGQNEIIQSEKEFAMQQERIANKQTEIAEEKSRIAVEQAGNGLKVIQDTLQFVDKRIANEPGMDDLRVSLAEMLSESLERIDPAVLDDEQGQAIPTLMVIRNQMVQVFVAKGKYEAAIKGMDELINMAKRRVEVKNGNDMTRRNLAILLAQKGGLVSKANGNFDQSIELCSQAISLVEDIIANPKPEIGDPNSPKLFEIKLLNGQQYQQLSAQYYVIRDTKMLNATLAKAISCREELLSTLPDDADFNELSNEKRNSILKGINANLLVCRRGLGLALMNAGEFERSFEIQEKAHEFLQSRAEKEGEFNLSNSIALANSYSTLAFNKFKIALRYPDRYQDDWLRNCKTQFQEGLKLRILNVNNFPDRVDLVYALSVTQYQFGILLEYLGESDSASKLFKECHATRKTLQEDSPSDRHYFMLMVAAARDGDWQTAREMAEEKVDTSKPTSLVKIARGFALASTVEGAPKEELLDLSFSAIESALANGFTDWFEIEFEPDLLQLLKERPVAQLLAQLKKLPAEN